MEPTSSVNVTASTEVHLVKDEGPFLIKIS